MQRARAEEQLRLYVQKAVRSRWFPVIWAWLAAQGYVDDVLLGARDRDWLVAEARARRDQGPSAAADPVHMATPQPTAGQERAWALSQLVARYAAQDPDVMVFRDKYLDGDLVAWSRIQPWIDSTAKADGDRTLFLTAMVPGSTRTNHIKGRFEIDPPIRTSPSLRFSTDTLSYAEPGDKAARVIAVNSHGTLGRLGRLAESTASGFGWRPAQATVFILCGVIPFISRVYTSVPPIKVHNGVRVGWAQRIVLDVDPGASVEDVAQAYREAVGGHSPTRRRSLSVKRLRLAAFAGAEHADMPWRDRFAWWNTTFPEWVYSQESNFRRDALDAQQRLLYPLG